MKDVYYILKYLSVILLTFFCVTSGDINSEEVGYLSADSSYHRQLTSNKTFQQTDNTFAESYHSKPTKKVKARFRARYIQFVLIPKQLMSYKIFVQEQVKYFHIDLFIPNPFSFSFNLRGPPAYTA